MLEDGESRDRTIRRSLGPKSPGAVSLAHWSRRWLRIAAGSVGLVLGVLCQGAGATNVETAIMPGRVIKGHANVEADCAKCHVRFDRAAQPRLCLDCHAHSDVASDVRGGTGHHGRIKGRECRACHTEHKGREARIVVLDEQTFDHALTDFKLRGKHVGAKCEGCHRPGTKHRAAPQECNGCHLKDDKHRGELGLKCERCHRESVWKDTRVDHDKTRFPLRYRHAEAKCTACHSTGRYTDSPRDCASCHRKDEPHKGQLGAQCDRCHDETKWKASSFQHDRDSRFALRGKHREAKCESCHKTPGFADKPPTKCASCHERDDAQKGHKGRYGDKCETCHGGKTWTPVTFDHDADTRYPLRGKHRASKCDDCHRIPPYEQKPDARCIACHARDDKHDGQLDKQCQNCHSEGTWRENSFDHKRSRFPLLGKHAQLRCTQCHAGLAFKDAKPECVSCHAKTNPHPGRYTAECQDCHDAQAWKSITYDHNPRGRFKMDGKHQRLACIACHKAPLKDKREPPSECADCHKKDDVHFATHGRLCQRCHVAQDWRSIINPEAAKPPARAP